MKGESETSQNIGTTTPKTSAVTLLHNIKLYVEVVDLILSEVCIVIERLVNDMFTRHHFRLVSFL